jgi:predicted MFS family arabinose efflux permease
MARRLPRAGLGRDVWLVALTSAFLSASFMGMLQLLKSIYVLRLGYGPEFTGVFFATGALSFSLSSIPGSIAGGRFGPRRLMIGGAIMMLGGVLLLPIAEFAPISARSACLLSAQIIASSGWSTYNVNQISAMMSYSTPENRKLAYGFRESMGGLGTFLGALIGGVLPALFAYALGTTTMGPAPYRYAIFASVLVGLIGLMPLFRVASVPVYPRSATRRAALPPLVPLAILLVCGFLNHAAMASSKVFYPPYLDQEFGLSTALIGLITSIGTALAVVAALASARLSRRRGTSASMMLAALGLAGSLLLMALIPTWGTAAVGAIVMLALMSVWLPSYQMRLMDLATPEQRSLVAGAGSMAMSLGFATMSFNGGRIAATAGYGQLFLLGSAIAMTCAALIWFTLRFVSRQEVAEPVPGRQPTADVRT